MAMADDSGSALAGVRVVEFAPGLSVVGAGMATNFPGALLREYGAEVTRVRTSERFTLDEGIEFERSWDRGKEIVEVADEDAAATVARLSRDADVVIIAGDEARIERRGLGYRELTSTHPRLVYTRVRPSFNASGPMPDVELLVQARTGLLNQVRGNRQGPLFTSLSIGNAGAAFAATLGTLALLYEREATGRGGWAETSLYDGLLAILPMSVGRVERQTPGTASLWNHLGPAIGLSFRCGDGEDLQLWFGAKGAYEAFLDHFGDPPSEAGYRADTESGEIGERSKRWQEKFATRDRAYWLESMAGNAFRVEPVLRPGEVLRDEHVREIGLSVEYDDPERGPITVLGPVGRVDPVADAGGASADGVTGHAPRLLDGIKVLDLSAFLAGPVTPQLLAELGADVVKVEPTTGDVHRPVEAMYAAGNRAKRTVAVNLKSPDAPTVMHRLFEWADVVHHNARVGLPERLGYDEGSVRRVNPRVVYCHASGFGTHGPRALLAANDHLMQALSGVEAAAGGEGQLPTFMPFGSIDVTGGWLAACAVLAGLYARRRTGVPQSASTSLLGAGMTLKTGAFIAGDTVAEGPILDGHQTGYGAAYRIYECGDGAWLALAVPSAAAWEALRAVVGVDDLPASPPPLRTRRGEGVQPAEKLLEDSFATRDAAAWAAELQEAGVPVELVLTEDRATFNARIFDDPVNRQLGRIATFEWGAHGRTDQPSLAVRLGPEPRPVPTAMIATLGEHTDEVLEELGVDADARAGLAASGTVTTGPAADAPAAPVGASTG
jgi:crotonobetainyl-CoA:carnitine CoA-transferase CaiB-like acyl-CoA transferase